DGAGRLHKERRLGQKPTLPDLSHPRSPHSFWLLLAALLHPAATNRIIGRISKIFFMIFSFLILEHVL
ncbi:MAG: hypothetical protein B7Z06_01215, partial [Flavobacteriales bacterium 32-35-8]